MLRKAFAHLLLDCHPRVIPNPLPQTSQRVEKRRFPAIGVAHQRVCQRSLLVSCHRLTRVVTSINSASDRRNESSVPRSEISIASPSGARLTNSTRVPGTTPNSRNRVSAGTPDARRSITAELPAAKSDSRCDMTSRQRPLRPPAGIPQSIPPTSRSAQPAPRIPGTPTHPPSPIPARSPSRKIPSPAAAGTPAPAPRAEPHAPSPQPWRHAGESNHGNDEASIKKLRITGSDDFLRLCRKSK